MTEASRRKRTSHDSNVEAVQHGNQTWWTENTMSYDWHDPVKTERYGAAWFDEIDRRFIYGSRLFAHDKKPFDRIIPLDALDGKAVLEIGCGMGLHTELLARAGAHVTAVDISETSIESTRRRLNLKGLAASVRQMDARSLELSDNSFDFVWSWGVIHHSAQTAAILREIHRVLRPGGEVRLMVYNLDGASAYTAICRDYLVGFWRGRTVDECLWSRTDGYMARYYSKDMLSDILSLFFEIERLDIYGQDADAVPLPRYLRQIVIAAMSRQTLERLANARGSFLFATARKPAT